MADLDNQQASPEADNSQAGPQADQNISDLIPDDVGDIDPDEEEAPEGDGPPDDEQDADPEADKTDAKALADDAEYTLPDGRKVTVGEMAKSFADFTRNSQELAAERQQTRQEALQAISQTREAQAHQLNLVAQNIMQLVAPGINEQTLYQLAQQDPESYFQHKAKLDAAQNFVAQISQAAQQAQQQAQQAQQLASQEAQSLQAQRMQQASEALSKESWFNNDFGAKSLAYLKTSGIPPDVIDAINKGMGGAAAIQLVRKAMLFDDAQKQRKTNKQPPPQTKATPNAKPAQGLLGKSKQMNALYDSASKGDRRAAGRWLSQVLPDA
jgi:hypothetical protein